MKRTVSYGKVQNVSESFTNCDDMSVCICRRRVELGTQAAAFVVWQHQSETLAKRGALQSVSSRCAICNDKMHGALAKHERETREWADSDDKKFDIVFVDGEGWAHRTCDEHVKVRVRGIEMTIIIVFSFYALRENKMCGALGKHVRETREWIDAGHDENKFDIAGPIELF